MITEAMRERIKNKVKASTEVIKVVPVKSEGSSGKIIPKKRGSVEMTVSIKENLGEVEDTLSAGLKDCW